METPRIVRAAVGRSAKLGELYNVRRDEFLRVNAFKGSLNDDYFWEYETNSSNIDFIETDSLIEKIEKLGIDAELGLSIMTGLVKMSGSAAYLQNQKSSTKTQQITLVYSMKTKCQEVDGIRNIIDKEWLNFQEATHIVVGISWGANCNITCQYQINQSEEEMQVKGKMKAEIEKLKDLLSIKCNAKADYSRKGEEDGTRFSYYTNCDVSDLSKEIPTTFEGALEVATSMPKVVLKTNDGKGIPVSYTLLSLNHLRSLFKMQINQHTISKQIENDTIKKCFQSMQAMREGRQAINDLIQEFLENNEAVPPKEFNDAHELLRKFGIEEAQFKSELARAIVAVRSSKDQEISTINDMLQGFLRGSAGPEKISVIMETYDSTMQKIRLVGEFKENSVLYIGKGGNMKLVSFQNVRKKVYAFYMDHSKRDSKAKDWYKHVELFFRLISAYKGDEDVQLVVIDCEINPDMTPKNGQSIQYYDDGVLRHEDLLMKGGQILSSLPKVKETNILIYGETGVGKSTWINAIANYFAFDTLQDAIDAKDIKVYIPSQFSYTSETGTVHKISVGSESENEVQIEGQSATQGPKAYRFLFRNHIICLIDTPGIGDLRGIEQDQKNFENTLSHLSYYDEIHGICLLLKPNESRLRAIFRFCISDLLSHLHKSAANNILFCFTNARNTFYRPGDTLPMLQRLLSEYKEAAVSISPKNQFCFDNEAFRFLACLKNGILFNEEDITTYSLSWKRAAEETKKLIEYVKRLQPHSIKNTISLNNARKIIIELSKPLAEITSAIQMNINSAIAKSEELEASQKTALELQDQLYLDAVDIEHVPLDHPRTVCTDKSCVEYIEISDTTHKTIYKQQCHKKCRLRGVRRDTINNSALQGCLKMGSNGICKVCNHPWNVHMHLTYDLRKKTSRVINEEKEKLLTKEKNAAADHHTFLTKIKMYIEELSEEQTQITEICAQLSCFLKKNAITPFNDDIDSHMQMLIKSEESKPSPSQNAIESLRKVRENYKHMRNVFYEGREDLGEANTGFASTPEEVEQLKQKLFGFKCNGSSLKKIMEGVWTTRNDDQYKEIEIIFYGN